MYLTLYDDLEKNMTEQIDLFGKVLDTNNNFRAALIDKEWQNVSSNIDKLNDLSNSVVALDKKRVDILVSLSEEINSKTSENCLSLILKAPEEKKDILVNTFYTLKSSIIQAQGVFKGVNDYVTHKKELSKEIIDVLIDDAKGNVYSKPGRRNQDSQGFLVNRQL